MKLFEFDEWFDALVKVAEEHYPGTVVALVKGAPFMYGGYWEQGLSPAQAMEEEWGQAE